MMTRESGRNPDRKGRINPGPARQHDDPAAHDHRGSGKRVTQLVNEGAADVNVMRGAVQHPGNGAVHQHANHRNPDHDAGMRPKPDASS